MLHHHSQILDSFSMQSASRMMNGSKLYVRHVASIISKRVQQKPIQWLMRQLELCRWLCSSEARHNLLEHLPEVPQPTVLGQMKVLDMLLLWYNGVSGALSFGTFGTGGRMVASWFQTGSSSVASSWLNDLLQESGDVHCNTQPQVRPRFPSIRILGSDEPTNRGLVDGLVRMMQIRSDKPSQLAISKSRPHSQPEKADCHHSISGRDVLKSFKIQSWSTSIVDIVAGNGLRLQCKERWLAVPVAPCIFADLGSRERPKDRVCEQTASEGQRDALYNSVSLVFLLGLLSPCRLRCGKVILWSFLFAIIGNVLMRMSWDGFWDRGCMSRMPPKKAAPKAKPASMKYTIDCQPLGKAMSKDSDKVFDRSEGPILMYTYRAQQ